MWHRNKNRANVEEIGMQCKPSFGDLFLSQSLRQKFNTKGFEFLSDENESAIIKYARLMIANKA